MLLLGQRLIGTPVMSLQVGAKIATTVCAIIDPTNLQIIAYEVEGPLLDQSPSFIRIADIRELTSLGMIVDSSDELVSLDDVIKLKQVHDLDFQLVGLRVIDERSHKLGKVDDYIVDTDSFYIQQLSVRGGIIASLSTASTIIHRSQIVTITDTVITVKSTDKKLTSLATTGAIHRNYVNPFRKPAEPQPEAAATD